MRPFCVVVLTLGAVAAVLAGPVQKSPTVSLEGKDLPMFLNYQGYLTDTLGSPINANVWMTFTIYPDSTGPGPLWSYSPPAGVAVDKGVFNVKLPLSSGDTSLFMTGERRWIELSVNANILSPRTEITTMAYGFRALYTDNSDMLDGRHASQFIYNQTALQTGSDFHIDGDGVAEARLVAYATGLASSAAVIGSASGDNTGVHGSSEDADGVYGHSSDAEHFGVRGFNEDIQGTGVAGSGCGDGLVYLVSGSGGAFSAPHVGLLGYATDPQGTGIAGQSRVLDPDTIRLLADGSGGTFNGQLFGLFGIARKVPTSSPGAGGLFRCCLDTDTANAYVAYWEPGSGQFYKVLGDGNVSTVMTTRDGRRILFAPESPEPLFEDFGQARLRNGHCRVDLDPLFLDCITVDAGHPLRVFVTLNDDCNGVYVKTDATGFDVRELGAGSSDAAFNYRVVGTRRGSEGLRLPAAPEAPATVKTHVGRNSLTPGSPR